MKQEDKQLLLKDLCARIPYWIDLRIQYNGNDYTPFGYGAGRISMLSSPIMSCTVGYAPMVEEVKPYLRPMSSMTEEEREEYIDLFEGMPFCPDPVSLLDWLNAHHFDYRDLIDKGLALEAPKDMYREEEK